jgi:Bacterial mobilisation protein (MobC)
MKSGSEKRRRQAQIKIRLTEDERRILDDKRGEMSPGDYIRHALLGSRRMRRRPSPSADTAALVKLHAQLGAIGNNLNQIARVANTSGRVREAMLEAALAEFLSLRQEILIALQVPPS